MPQPANPTSQSYYLDSTMDYFRDYIETIDSVSCSNMVPGMITWTANNIIEIHQVLNKELMPTIVNDF